MGQRQPRFALNHMTAPRLGLDDFFALARELNIDAVEIRNDLAGNVLLDGTPAGQVKAAAATSNLSILSINALQRFNIWDAARREEALALADYAAACGAQALVLVPLNDGSNRGEGERQANLRSALAALEPILAERGLIGLVEPLGFSICSLWLKSEAVAGIDAVDGAATFKLVHDTFHHHLAGESRIFPTRVGLVHISGVDDPMVSVPDMRDSHRVLVDGEDRLGNIAQIRELLAGGYEGRLSFEPFATSVQVLDRDAIKAALSRSMKFIREETLTTA
jgi:2-keto-myo-inositol isomerase